MSAEQAFFLCTTLSKYLSLSLSKTDDILPILTNGVSFKGGWHIRIQFIPRAHARGFLGFCYRFRLLKV